MLNPADNTVIVHIPIEPVVVRVNGADKKTYRLSQGFCVAEYPDGNIAHLSNPLEEWLLAVNVNGNAQGAAIGQNYSVYFSFDTPGKLGNPGQDDEHRSLIDIETYLP